MTIIKYDKTLDIRNVENISHGTGAKYLEVIESHIPKTYIAVQWRRKLVDTPSDHILISMGVKS